MTRLLSLLVFFYVITITSLSGQRCDHIDFGITAVSPFTIQDGLRPVSIGLFITPFIGFKREFKKYHLFFEGKVALNGIGSEDPYSLRNTGKIIYKKDYAEASVEFGSISDDQFGMKGEIKLPLMTPKGFNVKFTGLSQIFTLKPEDDTPESGIKNEIEYRRDNLVSCEFGYEKKIKEGRIMFVDFGATYTALGENYEGGGLYPKATAGYIHKNTTMILSYSNDVPKDGLPQLLVFVVKHTF